MSVFNMGYLFEWRNLRARCGREGCHTTTLRHPLAGRRMGILLGNDWFCSSDCFRLAVESRIRQLHEAACKNPPQRQSRLPLGLLLLSLGSITHAQLQLALQRQRESGGLLGDILCDLRLTTEQEVAVAAAMQWGCPVFTPKSKFSEIQARIPSALMQAYSMAPVHYAAPINKLLVGFVHGIEHQVLTAIERITSCVVAPCFITASDCWESIRCRTGQSNDVTFERVASVAEMATIVQSYAFQIGAEEARLEMCRNYLWARLNREGFPTDLIFTLAHESASTEEHHRMR